MKFKTSEQNKRSCKLRLVQEVEGALKGTSICQQKQSTCHDENMVYHISKKAANIYTIQASKIANGAEQDMGTFDSVVFNRIKLCRS